MRSATNRTELWERVRSGAIDWVASDHSPCPPAMRAGPDAWAGISGVQLLVPALLDAGLDPVAVARLTTEAARRLRLPGKGALAIGFDADLALVDPAARWVVERSRLLDRHQASPLLGRTLQGEVVQTFVRGRRVYERAAGPGPAGGGRFVRPG